MFSSKIKGLANKSVDKGKTLGKAKWGWYDSSKVINSVLIKKKERKDVFQNELREMKNAK